MKKMIGSGEWATELCEAFGEDPGGVRRMTLDVSPGEVVTVTLEKFVDKGNSEVIKVIKKHIWVEDAPEKDE